MKWKEPLSIHHLTLTNRIVMPPMATRSASHGYIDDEICKYYQKRAEKGYLGLIITEHMYIDKQGKADPNQISISRNCDIAGLRQLTKGIHREGSTRVFAQINHAGSMADPIVTRQQAVGPSPVLHPRQKQSQVPPRELSVEEIQVLVAEYAAAAGRAKAAGYDGVEIHAAHGYLLNQFYSTLTNHRNDAYGCDTLEKRIHFHLQVIHAIRMVVGTAYPLAIRFGGCDYQPGGSTINEAVEAAKLFVTAGVDLIDVSGGMNFFIRPDHTEPGYFRDMSSAIRHNVSVPVLLTGGVQTVEEAEDLLVTGSADMIGVGRAIFKDPGWPERELGK